MPTTKSDADCCFFSDSCVYWISYLVGRIQTWRWGPWSVGTGIQIYWERHGWILHLGWHPWILSSVSDGTWWDTFLVVKRSTDEVLGDFPCSFLYLRCCGGGRQAALAIENFLEVTASWGGEMRSVNIGSWVVNEIFWFSDEPSVFLCSPACLFLCNDENNFWEFTKQAHQGCS